MINSAVCIIVFAMLVISLKTGNATVSVTVTVPDPQAVVINHLSYQPRYFNPNNGEAEISFTLSKLAYVSVAINDKSGITIKELGPDLLTGGQHRFYWDGRLSGRRIVSPSWYTLILSAADGITSDKKTMEIAVSYGKPLKINNLTVSPKRFHPSGKEVVFRSVLSRDANVSLQITAEGGAAILSEQELLWSQGLNSYRWDGNDSQDVPVEPGTYTIYLTGTDSGGNLAGISQKVVALGERKPLGNILLNLLNKLFGIVL